jgi:hypothetical protein
LDIGCVRRIALYAEPGEKFPVKFLRMKENILPFLRNYLARKSEYSQNNNEDKQSGFYQ